MALFCTGVVPKLLMGVGLALAFAPSLPAAVFNKSSVCADCLSAHVHIDKACAFKRFQPPRVVEVELVTLPLTLPQSWCHLHCSMGA